MVESYWCILWWVMCDKIHLIICQLVPLNHGQYGKPMLLQFKKKKGKGNLGQGVRKE